MNIRLWPDSSEWSKIFFPEASFGEMVIRTLVVFFVVLVVFRLVGKKEVNQAVMTDLLMVILIAEIAGNAMIGQETSVLGCLTSAMTLVGSWYILNWFTARSEKATKFVEGTPTLMVAEGKMLTDNMKKENLSREELFAALRGQGIESLSDVRYAVMELDGKLSIIQKDAPDSKSASSGEKLDLWEEVISEPGAKPHKDESE